ncbi:hypothetical protein Y032_0087g2077 [Ancylostoma ceylanicum]|nr:hypothetical protein Y032_0087g2077 [Ancylostoma ceylanicum]
MINEDTSMERTSTNNVAISETRYCCAKTLGECNQQKSCFKLSVSRNSFKSPKKNWLCSLKENTNAAKKTRPCYDITDFYNNEGFCGMKWDKANKSTEFVVSSIQNSLEEHLSFVLQKANVLCLKLVDLEGVDMEVVTNVLRLSKARVSHLQLVINRTMSSEIVSVIDATGAETIDIVMSDVNFFRNLPFRSSVFRKAWSVTIRTSLMDASDMLDITDADLLSLTADSIEFFGTTSITAEGARRLVQVSIDAESSAEHDGNLTSEKGFQRILKSPLKVRE